MTAREELHALVDRLSDDAAAAALAYVRHLVQVPQSGPPTAQERLTRRMGPSAITGAAFFAQPPADLATLAAQQGVRPVATFEDLLVDIWPEDEDIDEFIATLRRWRHEDAYA
jgi:hypothetical protein